MATAVLIAIGLVILAGFALFGFTSLREGETRAARIAFAACLASLPFFLAPLLPQSIQLMLLGLAGIALLFAVALFLLPMGRVEAGQDEPHERFDERDVMFARAHLEPGSANYEAYYAMRPENKKGDDETRSLPGIRSPKARDYHTLGVAATNATNSVRFVLWDAIDGPVNPEQMEVEPASMAGFVKDLTRYYGARKVGITNLQPYHVYSHIGRGSGEYGAPVELDHRFAIAFTVEMDPLMVGPAPYAPMLMEVAREYLEAAKIAVELANWIRLLGYPARVHIAGEYRIIAPLVARDAGLGEIGRMGVLITPELGPRVRLGVVTTDLPLDPDVRVVDPTVLDFCRICEKCYETCPPKAIPTGDRWEIDGALRWRINADVCFRYWNAVGTACGVCMSVCPYSHPDSLTHNAVRWAVQRSGAARRAVVRLDDLFYGSHPDPKPFPAWLPEDSSMVVSSGGEGGSKDRRR